jgi:flagellar basal body rod protein FlgC
MPFMAIQGVSSASASAVSGIRAASERLETGAANLISEMTRQTSDTVSVSAEGRAALGSGSDTGVAQSMVDLRMAKYQNAASIAVFRTADEMTRDLVDLGKRT